MDKDPVRGRQLVAGSVALWIVSVVLTFSDQPTLAAVLFLIACGMLIFGIVLGLSRTIRGDSRRPMVPPGLVPCPACAEPIRPEAKICRFCATPLEDRDA
jgi:hypothetical protein